MNAAISGALLLTAVAVCASARAQVDAGVGADAAAVEAPASTQKAALRVGYAGSPPFVLKEPGPPRGLSIAVWEEVAKQQAVTTHWRAFPSVAELLQAVARGEVDVGVGPISVTAARAAQVDFLRPYFTARLGILAFASSSAWDRVRPLFSRAFLLGALFFLVVLFVVGTLVWRAERAQNPQQFPQSPHAGIANGMWFALVTMTTVGYGDRAPVTPVGRMLTSVWMLLSMVAASSVTAGLTSALTLSQIDSGGIASLDDLPGRRVAVVHGTPAEKIARRRSARRFVVDSKEAAIGAVRKGAAEAMLYDLPVLDYYLQAHPEDALVAHGTPVGADDYAFAVAPESPLRRPLDLAVLSLRERGELAEIVADWLDQT